MPERVPDLGAVERAHSSIKLCAASLFETCSTGVEVAQNPATKDESRGRVKSMKRAASRVGPDPDDSPSPTATESDGSAAGCGRGVRGRENARLWYRINFTFGAVGTTASRCR